MKAREACHSNGDADRSGHDPWLKTRRLRLQNYLFIKFDFETKIGYDGVQGPTMGFNCRFQSLLRFRLKLFLKFIS